MLHTGWSSTHCRSCRDGMDRWKPSFLACTTGSPIAVARRDLSPVTGTVSHTTKTNGIDRLPCGYLIAFDTEQVSPQVVSVLVVAIEEIGCSWFMSLLSSSPFWINACHKMHKIRTGSATVSGRSKQASKQAYPCTSTVMSRLTQTCHSHPLTLAVIAQQKRMTVTVFSAWYLNLERETARMVNKFLGLAD